MWEMRSFGFRPSLCLIIPRSHRPNGKETRARGLSQEPRFLCLPRGKADHSRNLVPARSPNSPTQLCRVKIDLPNSLDSDWKIDVKKASAQPPRAVRQRLRTLIETLGTPSRRVYVHRGTQLAEANPLPVWSRVQKDGNITFRVNRDHPSLVKARSAGNPEDVSTALSLIESALPLDGLLADLGNSPNEVTNATMSDDELRSAIKDVLALFPSSPETVEAIFAIGEPFRSHPESREQYLRN